MIKLQEWNIQFLKFYSQFITKQLETFVVYHPWDHSNLQKEIENNTHSMKRLWCGIFGVYTICILVIQYAMF